LCTSFSLTGSSPTVTESCRSLCVFRAASTTINQYPFRVIFCEDVNVSSLLSVIGFFTVNFPRLRLNFRRSLVCACVASDEWPPMTGKSCSAKSRAVMYVPPYHSINCIYYSERFFGGLGGPSLLA
jgi:hypothetical protein